MQFSFLLTFKRLTLNISPLIQRENYHNTVHYNRRIKINNKLNKFYNYNK